MKETRFFADVIRRTPSSARSRDSSGYPQRENGRWPARGRKAAVDGRYISSIHVPLEQTDLFIVGRDGGVSYRTHAQFRFHYPERWHLGQK